MYPNFNAAGLHPKFNQASIVAIEKKSATLQRFATLDAIRGLAAVGVVLSHLLLVPPEEFFWYIQIALRYTPFEPLIDGAKFVWVFFTISGFVLFLQFLHGAGPSVLQFYTRRLFRIYPAFLVAGIGTVIMLSLLPNSLELAGVGLWVREEIIRPQPGLQTIAEHLLLIGTPEGLAINIPSWSLVHEMRMVVLFPLLAACVIRADWLCLVASILISWAGDLLCMTWGGDTHEFHSATTLSGAIGATAHFMPYFVAGMVLVKRLDIILAFLKTASPLVLASLWVLAILAMRRREVMISGPGCALILALCLGSPAIRRFLERPLIQYLGIISYSFYLVHVPVLVFVLYVLNGTLPLPAIMAVALVASLALAHLFNIWIDSPAGALGKRLTAHWTQRSANDASKSVV